jgi:Ca-activated chloride channel family protein
LKWTNALLAFLVVVALAPTAFGQSRPRRVEPRAGEADVGADAVVTLEGALIEVPVVVADRTGRYVANLRQQDFELLEDGQRQAISFFRAERLPIHVALLLDTSLSTRFALEDIQEAAIDFVHQLLPGDQIMIVSFASEVTIEQEFTSNRRLLTEAVRRARPTRGTRLYESVYRTAAERLQKVDGRKAIVILSDGQDVGSAVTADQAIGVCSESDVSVYGIRYPRAADLRRDSRGKPPSAARERRDRSPRTTMPRVLGLPRVDWPPTGGAGTPQVRGRARRGLDPFMETVTARSGGTLYSASAIGDIEALFKKVAEELRHVYVLGYAPSNPVSSGGYRAIDVAIPSQPDLAVRHRLGYQAGAKP